MNDAYIDLLDKKELADMNERLYERDIEIDRLKSQISRLVKDRIILESSWLIVKDIVEEVLEEIQGRDEKCLATN